MEDQVAAALFEERMLAALSSAFGALAAILAAIGIHSMSASLVARRRREIGIRMALGAAPNQLTRMVIRDMSAVVGWGLAIGVPASVAAGVAARSLLARALFEVTSTDPFILVTSVLSILLIASLAAYAPAHRAAQIDPIISIKDV